MAKKNKPSKSQRRRSRNEQVVKFWSRRLDAAKAEKEEYSKLAKEVQGFFKSRHEKLFESSSVSDHFLKFQGAAAVSIPKTAQIRNSLGPHLYYKRPIRKITPNTDDGVMVALARVLEAYLAYTAKEGGFSRQSRKAINDSLVRGRGFLQVGWDDEREIITSWFVSSKHVFLDPDVDCMEDCEWIAVRIREPIWRTQRRLKDRGESWRGKGLKPNVVVGMHSIDHEYDELDDEEKDETTKVSHSNELLEYYRIYSKMGAGVRGSDWPGAMERYDDSDDYVALEICVNHDTPLYEGDWEVPLYLDKAWPLCELDFVETDDDLWPISIMGLVLPLQVELNLLSSLMLNSAKHRGKVVIAGDKSMEAQVQARIRSGGMAEYVGVELKQGERLDQKVRVLDFGHSPPEIMLEREYITREFEATTGVTPVVHGAQVEGSQERSATAAQQKSDAASVRLADMKERNEEFHTRVGRIEAIMARLELEADEVAPYVRQSKIGMYLLTVELDGSAPLPIRDRRTDEERQALNSPLNPQSVQEISPTASNYFATVEEAAEAMLGLFQELQQSVLGMSLLQRLGDPDPGMGGIPSGLGIAPVTVEDVWRDTAGISAQELMREFAYEMATGSTQKIDKQRDQQLVNDEMTQVMPVAIQAGDYQLINRIFEHRDDAYEIPQDQRLPPLQPPPPPAPEPTAAGEGGQS